MIRHPLSRTVVFASWSDALTWWPVCWMTLAAVQGLGVAVLGGDWIGLAVPWGDQPWALVNEPSVGFAATRAALFGYWLAPFAGAVLISVGLTGLVSTGRGWHGELLLYHAATAAAVLGLGWAPSLGLDDGPIAGLFTFWEVSPGVSVVTAAVVGATVASIASHRLLGHLWHHPTGPTRRRRVAVVLLHGWVPFAAWIGGSTVLGWPLDATALIAAVVVLLGPLVDALVFVPRAALRRRQEPSARGVLAMLILGLVIVAVTSWAGAAAGVRSKAVLWAEPGQTNNIRPETMLQVRIRPPRVRQAPPAPSTPES